MLFSLKESKVQLGSGDNDMGSLDSDWLAVEFANIDAEISDWNDGLKASFHSLFQSDEIGFTDEHAPESGQLPEQMSVTS